MQLDRRMVLAAAGGVAGAGLAYRLLFSTPALAAAAPRADLYSCEGCEAAFERPFASLTSNVTIAGPREPGERMVLTGQVLTADGARPAANVIVYAHHTNVKGLYGGGFFGPKASDRHGRLRGWAKTDADGTYRFDTIKPAPYPDRSMPAHVHIYIGEAGKRAYYVDDVVFAGEFGVTPKYIADQQLRSGSGIVTLTRMGNGVLLARRDIRLERHPV